jgi:serine O-acetyltransferase
MPMSAPGKTLAGRMKGTSPGPGGSGEAHASPPSGLVALLREDWVANGRAWDRPGFRAVAVHRFGVWLLAKPRIVRAPLYRVYRLLFRFMRNHYGIELPLTTRVGRRLSIGHQGGIVIHPRAEIGDDVVLRQNVTIGAASADRTHEAPRLGDRVEVGAGAVVIGRVRIGDGARIGPNAVVMSDVPAGATAFAAPARVIVARGGKEASH